MQTRFFKNKKNTCLYYKSGTKHLFPAFHTRHGFHIFAPVPNLQIHLLTERRQTVFGFWFWFLDVCESVWGSVPSLVWCPLSSLTWGLPSGPWSPYFWIQTELSSCRLPTPSLSSEPASWTSLQGPSPSELSRGSRNSESCNCWGTT